MTVGQWKRVFFRKTCTECAFFLVNAEPRNPKIRKGSGSRIGAMRLGRVVRTFGELPKRGRAPPGRQNLKSADTSQDGSPKLTAQQSAWFTKADCDQSRWVAEVDSSRTKHNEVWKQRKIVPVNPPQSSSGDSSRRELRAQGG